MGHDAISVVTTTVSLLLIYVANLFNRSESEIAAVFWYFEDIVPVITHTKGTSLTFVMLHTCKWIVF